MLLTERAFLFPVLDIFFKKNEEVIWSVHLQTYLLKFGERGPSVFFQIAQRKTGSKTLQLFEMLSQRTPLPLSYFPKKKYLIRKK